jgi:arsenite methyltransferase
VSGALAERDFVEKLRRAGFVDIEVLHRQPFGVEDAALYPLFTDDLVALMRRLIPLEKQDVIATAIVVRARRRD